MQFHIVCDFLSSRTAKVKLNMITAQIQPSFIPRQCCHTTHANLQRTISKEERIPEDEKLTAIANDSLISCLTPPSRTPFVSLSRDGTTPTVAMYRNPPAVMGMMHDATSTDVPKSPPADWLMAAMRIDDSSGGVAATADVEAWRAIPMNVPTNAPSCPLESISSSTMKQRQDVQR